MAGRTKPPEALVHAGLVLVQVCFGLHYLAAKVLLAEIPPRVWAPLRVGAAALLLLLYVGVTGRRLPRRWDVLGRLALYSVFGVVINQLCFVEGLSRTTPGHASVIMTGVPVATLMFAVLLRREQACPWKLAAVALGFAGVLLVIRPWAASPGSDTTLGDLLTLTNALSYSLFLVVSKRILAEIDALAATTVLLLFGATGMLVPGLPALAGFDLGSVSPTTWVLGAWIVIFPTAGAYLVMSWALARVESSIAALFIYLQPVIALSLSAALLGERPAPATMIGAILVFVAVYLAVRPRDQRSRASRARSSAPRGRAASSMSKDGE